MRSGRIIGIAVCLLVLLRGSAFGGAPSRISASKPLEVFQGEIVELRVSEHRLSTVNGRMGKEMISFYAKGRGIFTALVGVDLEAVPGLAKVAVKATDGAGTVRDTEIILNIKAGAFQRESFSVPPELDQLSPDVLERIRHEHEQLSNSFTTSAPRPLWDGPFLPPVSGHITSPFGFRRIINGIPRAPHSGVDLKALQGTEVLAPNHGRVVLIGDFFFSGRSLVLDHGGGLYTMYFHLSDSKVDTGMEVRKGDVIALSGMTGRATGPHLHWGARINGARVNPLELIKKLGDKSGTTPTTKAALRGGKD